MGENKQVYSGTIFDVFDGYAVVDVLYRDESNCEKHYKTEVAFENIKLKTLVAPIGLISKQMMIKYEYSSAKVEVFLPKSIDFIIAYGRIAQTNNKFVTLVSESASYNTALDFVTDHNSKKIPSEHIAQFLNAPFQIFLSKGICVGCKNISFSFSLELKLQGFLKNKGSDVTSHVTLRDNDSIDHLISSDFLFFKNLQIKMPLNCIEQYKKESAKLLFSNNQIVAELCRHCKIKLHENCERIFEFEYNKTRWHAKKYNYINQTKNSAVLIGILETIYRFQDLDLKEKISGLIKTAMTLSEQTVRFISITEFLDSGKSKSKKDFEYFYKFMQTNSNAFSWLSSEIIKNPENLEEISIYYEVVFTVISKMNNKFDTRKYSPKRLLKNVPIIYLYEDNSNNWHLVYPDAMMEYDGINNDNLYTAHNAEKMREIVVAEIGGERLSRDFKVCNCSLNETGPYFCAFCSDICRYCALYISKYYVCPNCNKVATMNASKIRVKFKCRTCLNVNIGDLMFPFKCKCIFCKLCLEQIVLNNVFNGKCHCGSVLSREELVSANKYLMTTSTIIKSP